MPTVSTPTVSAAHTSPSARNRQTQVRGWLLVVIGCLLAAGMAYAIVSQAPLMLQPGQAIGGTTFTGSAEQGRAALGLFAAVALLGASFAAGGVQLLRHGGLARWLVMTLLGSGALLAVTFWHVMSMF
jgi:hypothetical protein